jgi:hypothetical protein
MEASMEAKMEEMMERSTIEESMERQMEEMMERKWKVRMEQMEVKWNNQYNNSIARMTQLEHSTCEHANIVQHLIKEAETKLGTLTSTLTAVTDRIEEANNTIAEIDDVTDTMADFKETEEVARAAYISQAKDIRLANGRDAKAVATGITKAKQTLFSTQAKLMTELTSTTLNRTSIEVTRKAIEKESQKAIGEIRAEKDRNMENINDKSRSVRDEFNKLTSTTEEAIVTIAKEAIDTMDITLRTVQNQSDRAVETVINGLEFETTVQNRIDEYIHSNPVV